MAIAQTVVDNGADMIGYIFADSKRYVEPKIVAEINKNIKGIAKVGVFVNEKLSLVNEIAEFCNLDYVQLHGDEDVEYCKGVNCKIIKAFRYNENFSVDVVNRYQQASYILVDSYQKGIAGGTGKIFSWMEAKNTLSKINKPLLIAGGLNINNISECIETLKPTGVDISGGVETNGQKDNDKIIEILNLIKNIKE